MPDQFHFLQPIWFLALIPVAVLLWWLPRAQQSNSHWQHACESHLLPYLLDKPAQAISQLPMWLLASGWLLTVVALADPVWQKQPQPVYRNQDASVVVLDLSRSMLSSDLAPSRLERARYKVADILKQRKEGQTGLVVFAGDAFTVSPLTNDTHTIESLLQPLHPDLMPAQGSRADRGIQQAGELLKQAGISHGKIVLVTDGFSDTRALDVATELNRQGYRLSVLGVGGDKPAPIPNRQGGFIRDSSGNIALPELDTGQLQRLANAGGGFYSTISTNDSDLMRIMPASSPGLDSVLEKTDQASELWQSQGPWLVLALLPLAALAFRRGWLLSLPLVVITMLGSLPQPAMASVWDDLWQRRDQQANQALQSGELERAQQLAKTPFRRGEAAYRNGDYEAALSSFSDSDDPQSNYNRGNTLAQLGRYEEAVAAYDKALALTPDMVDASHNKSALEKLLEQQQDENDQQNNESDESEQADNNDASDNTDGENAPSEDQQSGDNTDEQQQAEQQTGDEDNSNDTAENNEDPPSDADQQRDETQQAQQDNPDPATADTPLDTASYEQKQADERWLRRVPDDPGGLLRRKFLYQYSQRGTGQQDTSGQDW